MSVSKKVPLSIDEIPEEEREGHTVIRHERSWERPDEEYEYAVYVPSEREEAMIKANVEARQERARADFDNVPDAVKDVIGRVLEKAMDSISYGPDAFDKIDVTGATAKIGIMFETVERPVEKPDGPGRVFTARGVQGGNALPQQVENMKRLSIVDGLDLMFPPDAQRSYFNDLLSKPFLQRETEYLQAQNRDYGGLRFRMEHLVGAIVHGGLPNRTNFSARGAASDGRAMLDRNVTGNPDNIHDRNALAIRDFLLDKPEYIVGLFMWTRALTDYCRDLKSYVRTEMGPNQQAVAKEAPFWDTVALVEGGNEEKKHFYESGSGEKYANIDKGNKLIPSTGLDSFLYFAPVVSAVMGALLEHSGITHKDAAQRDVDPASYKAAFEKLSLSGIFQRAVEEGKERVLIRCPMSKKMGEWLTIDLGGQGKPEDQLLARIVEKVRQELAAPDWNMSKRLADTALRHIHEHMDFFAEHTRPRLDAHAAKCPFHHDR